MVVVNHYLAFQFFGDTYYPFSETRTTWSATTSCVRRSASGCSPGSTPSRSMSSGRRGERRRSSHSADDDALTLVSCYTKCLQGDNSGPRPAWSPCIWEKLSFCQLDFKNQ